jgi:hypothetical protein
MTQQYIHANVPIYVPSIYIQALDIDVNDDYELALNLRILSSCTKIVIVRLGDWRMRFEDYINYAQSVKMEIIYI